MIEKAKRGRLGWIILAAASLMPLVLWWLPYGGPQAYFGSAVNLSILFAKTASLTATALMACSLILAARFRVIEKLFGGLDELYIAHHMAGALAFTLILVHVLFLSLKFWLLSGPTGLKFLWFSGTTAITLGIIAFAGLLIVIAATALWRLPYRTFVQVHRLLGIIFLLGATHAFAVNAQMATNHALKVYMLALTAVAVLAYVYHSLLGGVLIRYKRYKLTHVQALDATTWELRLKRLGRPLQFRAGQFAYLQFRGIPALGIEAHPFSIASGERQSDLRFVVKTGGDYTAHLDLLKTGATALIEGPFGGFNFRSGKHKRQVWIAGGVGITPFLSMAQNLPKKYKVDLYYCAKTLSEALFLHELQAVAKAHGNLRIVPVCEDSDGFLSVKMITAMSGELANKDIMLCGPPVMSEALRKQFAEAKVPGDNIYYEDFSY